MSNIGHLLELESICLDESVDDWRAAIRCAGGLLERQGAISGEYTRAMIASVEENGPYIVVAPGFAFAHARPSEAVHRTAMSWVRLAHPVEFGHASNDPVTLVVALSAKDQKEHLQAMRKLATLLASPTTRTALDRAETPEEVLALLTEDAPASGSGAAPAATGSASSSAAAVAAPAAPAEPAPAVTEAATEPAAGAATESRNKILTVCGNGLGTSLFLKNTLEQVLDRWGWSPYLTVEATDTISARGKAKEADVILTSGEIARALGDVGVPVKVIQNFTSTTELDAAMRDLYDV
ncbi:PTS sugar transporter subunit IIA [Kocuria turfanensis]|uniref:Ascorbate-specific PTS system EIIA component n=1 Tax=Kocuria turfanensis TaxID=388357 RepID=A0A512IGX6_9MICC|nr:PTS sugar transporter subunit IIA [Kocuria turfanensis]GEO96920.1 PTS sugar transporter [Kocuria turfanensis]